MKKYMKPFLLVLFNNVLGIMLLDMIKDWNYWGIVLIFIIGIFYLVSFSMLVVGIKINLISDDNNIEYNSSKKTISKTNNKSIKGEELLNSLLIKGKYATFDSGFSNDEIYTALHKCKDLLPLPCCDNDILCENISPLSARQGFCSNAAIELIMDNKYNDALHEFEDCIDDYGKGENRYITKNELILYNCILSCFISKLEAENKDLER